LEEDRWIKIDLITNPTSFVISVTDSGNGIPTDFQDKLFQPFFTTKEIGRGTGLGLSLSSAIAKHHGGSLTLDNDSSNTRFVLEIPRMKPKQTELNSRQAALN